MGDETRWDVSGSVVWNPERYRTGPSGGPTDLESRAHSPADLEVDVIDLDPFGDDLIASGRPARDGTFHVSFGRAEFNLDRFEREDWPELWIVVNRVTDGGRVPVESFGLPRTRWNGHTIDVGTIELDPHLLSLPSSEDVPDADGGSRDRVPLDERSLRSLANRTLPEVEALTGWTIDLSSIDLRATDRLADLALGRRRESMPRVLRSLVHHSTSDLLLGVYDPSSRVVGINPRCARLPAESVEIVLGHELVHVGQFDNIPNLNERVQRAHEDLQESMELAELDDADELGRLLKESELNRIQTALEGQAAWVQAHLEARRPLSIRLEVDESFSSRILRASLAGLGHSSARQVKIAQYRDGATAIRNGEHHGASLPGWLLDPDGTSETDGP